MSDPHELADTPEAPKEGWPVAVLTRDIMLAAFQRKDQRAITRGAMPETRGIDLSQHEYLGWYDIGQNRGYIVAPYMATIKGIVLTPTTISRPNVVKKCQLCGVDNLGTEVVLFSTPSQVDRRKTCGLYMCKDLCCSQFIRGTMLPKLPIPPTSFSADAIQIRITALKTNLDLFFGRIFSSTLN